MFLDLKTTISEMKNTPEELVAEWTMQKKILMHKDVAIKTIQNETRFGKTSEK